MNEDTESRSLKREIEKLPRELRPQRDLWPGIEHGLLREPVSHRRPLMLAAAASVILAVLLTWTLQKPGDGIDEIDSWLQTLETEHQATKRTVLAAYRDRTVLYQGWEEQMQQLEAAEAAVYQALRTDPTNRDLLAMLRDLQIRQLELIEAVHAPRMTSI